MDATSLPVLGGRAPREAGETVLTISGASDESLGRIDPGHTSGARRAQSGGRHVHESGHARSEEHTSELQSPCNLVCRLLLEKKKLPSTSPSQRSFQTMKAVTTTIHPTTPHSA